MNSTKIYFLALFLIVFTRVLTFLGFPTVVNFINFPITLVIFLFHLGRLEKVDNIFKFLVFLLATTIIFSNLLNQLGLANIILQILLYLSFFLFFISLVSTEWTKDNFNFFNNGFACIFIINILFSYFQFFVLGHAQDDIHGIALNLGTAAHLNGAINLISFLFFSFVSNFKYKIFSYLFALISLPIIFLAGANQVILVTLLSWSTLLLLRTGMRKDFLKGLIWFIFGVVLFYYAIRFNFLPSRSNEEFLTGFEIKFSVLKLIFLEQSFAQILLGMGPGQTISRLAIESIGYKDILQNFGFVHSPLAQTLYKLDFYNYYEATASSLFSMKFSWAGIFGDLGFLGILLYSLILIRINIKYCLSQVQKFCLISTFYYGLIYTWLEEPIFMLLNLSFLAIVWQKNNFDNKKSSK